MSELHKNHVAQIDAYSRRVDRLAVLLRQLQAEVFDEDRGYPESLLAVTNFLDDEIEDTKAEANRLVDIEVGRSEGHST